MTNFDEGDLAIRGDETIEESGGREKFPAGDYSVIGIEKYFSTEDELPAFVPQGERLVARFNLKLGDGSREGPPMSATVDELRRLVIAFGGDVSNLGNEPSTAFLLSAMELSNKGGKIRQCRVNTEGWVSFVEATQPPANKIYTWEFDSAKSLDGSVPVRFQQETRQGIKGDYPVDAIKVAFRITGNMYGQPTPYDGYRIWMELSNPFEGFDLLGNGRKRPATKMGPKGGIPVAVQRFIRFAELFCGGPGIGRPWEEDPGKSELGINEIDNPVAVYIDKALSLKSRVLGLLVEHKSKSGGTYLRLNIEDMSVPDSPPVEPVRDLDQEKTTAQSQPMELELLVRSFDLLAGFPVFVPTPKDATVIDLTYTPKGKEWMVENAAPVWDDLNLPKNSMGLRELALLNPEQLTRLTSGVKDFIARKQRGDTDLPQASF